MLFLAATSGLDRLVTEGDTILRLMQMEVKKVPLNDRPDLQRLWEQQNRDWQNVKRTLLQATSSSSAQGLEGSSSSLTASNSSVGRMKQGRKILEDTNQSVYRATVIAQENEAIGVEVMGELAVQRDALVRTRDRLQDADQDLTRTHKVLRSMNRRVWTNKCLLIVIILMELGILLIVVYMRFIRKKE